MNVDIVCFDCDSTLSKIEGIDELAQRAGLGSEMARLTNLAMNGEVPLEAVYERRLTLIQPDRLAIEWLADLYVEQIVDGAAEVCATLLDHGKQVHIISGGIRQAIMLLAEKLGVPEKQIHAVDLCFNDDGSYNGFNSASPLARSGGKAEVCRSLINNQASLVMVGDGQTDLESKQAGAFFIGFGGVVKRSAIASQADKYIEGDDLRPVVEYIL